MSFLNQFLQEITSELKSYECCPSNPMIENFNRFVETMNQYPFLVYILEHGAEHIIEKKHSYADEFQHLLKMMNQSGIRFLLGDWGLGLAKRLGIRQEPLAMADTPTDQMSQTFKNCVLHCAAAQGLRTAVDIAVKSGAETKSQSMLHLGEDAICLAIEASAATSDEEKKAASKSIVQSLLDNGADPNARTRFKGTPLHYAAKHMTDGILDLLLKNGAKVNAKDFQDMTPLHRAITGPRNEEWVKDESGPAGRDAMLPCVQKLVDAGADLHAGDNQGHKPIHWAAGKNRLEITKFLVESASRQPGYSMKRAVNEECLYRKAPPLHWAARNGHNDVLDDMLSKLVDDTKDFNIIANSQDQSGRRPLIWASQGGHLECVRTLVEWNATVNLAGSSKGVKRGTPFSWAVTNDHLNIVEFLLQHDASVAYNDEASPLLCLAAHSGNVELFETILVSARQEHLNLDIDEADKMGHTPFMTAAQCGHVDLIGHLHSLQQAKKVTIDVNHTDSEGNTAPLLATVGGKLESVKFLVKHVATVNVKAANTSGDTVLLLAAGWGHWDIVKWLIIQQTVDINGRNKFGNTVLLLAVGWDHLDMVKWLVDKAKGVDINAANIFGNTALHCAAGWGSQGIIRFLCSRGAKRNVKNGEGKKYDTVSVYGQDCK